MLKKINIILVCAFSALTIKYIIGFALLSPIILFYLMKEFKNIYYTYIPSIIMTVLFSFKDIFALIYSLSIITIIYFIYRYISRKINYKFKYINIIYSVMLVIINISSYYIFKHEISLGMMIIFSLLSGMIYLYLDYFILKMINNLNDHSILCLDIVLSLIAIIGGLNQEIYYINLGLLIASFFMMYFARNYKNITSIVYSFFLTILGFGLFKIEEFLFIPIISGMYLINSIYVILPLNGIIILSIFFLNNVFQKEMLVGIMGITIIFEILNIFIINNDSKKIDSSENIYDKIQSSTSQELLKYALFLDKFANTFKNPKEYNEHISSGIKTIVHNFCTNCPKQKECFEKYRSSLYMIFKSIIKKEEQDCLEFNGYCPNVDKIKYICNNVLKQINQISPKEKANNNILLAQINGFSNTIKKYVLDINSKEELNYIDLINLKKALIDFGYNITYYEISKQYVDDFLITIGFKGIKFITLKEELKDIAHNYINQDLSVVFYKEDNRNIYVNIIPKIKIDVTYGFGSLSYEGLDICGDNYLVKEMQNGRFISAISDGMGKGYRAFYESNTTLNLIEDIISLNISTDTALDILNTYYTVQEYLEEYATLDFIEINRYKKRANFYKMGATSSYIFKKNGHIDKIINKHLPFGIDDEIDVNTYDLESGDLILMSSDGIFENVVEEKEFESFIGDIKNYPPQRIVYEILNYTLNHKIQTKDDMSIVALKVQNVA